MTFGQLWDRFWITLDQLWGNFWRRFGIPLGPLGHVLLCSCNVLVLENLGDHLGVHFRTTSGAFWDNFGITFGPLWISLGSTFGDFG